MPALPFANSRVRGPIKHVVFIVKENRTFDQVFGQRRGDDAATRRTGSGDRACAWPARTARACWSAWTSTPNHTRWPMLTR